MEAQFETILKQLHDDCTFGLKTFVNGGEEDGQIYKHNNNNNNIITITITIRKCCINLIEVVF